MSSRNDAVEPAAAYEDTLRSLALNDEQFMEWVPGMGRDTVDASCLDPKTHALMRLVASLAVGAAPSSYHSIVETAQAAAAEVDEIVGCLIAVDPTVGLAPVVSAAPELAPALGDDAEGGGPAYPPKGTMRAAAIRGRLGRAHPLAPPFRHDRRDGDNHPDECRARARPEAPPVVRVDDLGDPDRTGGREACRSS